jgi:hypothetical protein
MSPGLHIPIVRVVRLAPEQAEMAFDAALLAGCMEMDLQPSRAGGNDILRRFVGRLRSPWGWSTLPVELELSAWSNTKSALTLRPLVNTRGSGWRRWFFGAGHAFMDRLVTAMEVPAVSEVAASRTPGGHWQLSA